MDEAAHYCVAVSVAFENVPIVIKEIHTHLKTLLNEREQAAGLMIKLMQDVNTMSLDKLDADVMAKRAQHEISDAMLRGMGVGWTSSFLSTCNPLAFRNLIGIFVRDVDRPCIGT